MTKDFFTNRDDNTAPEKRDDFADFRRNRKLRRIAFFAAAAVMIWGILSLTEGNFMMACLILFGLAATLGSLWIRVRSMAAGAKGMPPARIALNIAVAAAILLAIFYFYTQGFDRLLEP